MRYHWGLGVRHIHVHQPTSASSCIPNRDQPDVETSKSDNALTDLETVLAKGDLEVTTVNNACHEFADHEMVLEDCDPEGWDDVESDCDSSEGGGYDDDSEDDFGDIYDSTSQMDME